MNALVTHIYTPREHKVFSQSVYRARFYLLCVFIIIYFSTAISSYTAKGLGVLILSERQKRSWIFFLCFVCVDKESRRRWWFHQLNWGDCVLVSVLQTREKEVKSEAGAEKTVNTSKGELAFVANLLQFCTKRQ